MHILIENSSYELKNMGDLAMLQTALLRMNALFPSAEFHILTTNPGLLNKYFLGNSPVLENISINGRALWHQSWNIMGGLHKLIPHSMHDQLICVEDRLRNAFPHLTRPFIKKRFKRRGVSTENMDSFFALVNKMDCVVATGGGYINDIFPYHAINVLQLLSIAQHAGCPTFLFGQGVGPIYSPRIKSLCRQVFPKLDYIGLREGLASLPLALSLGANPKNVSVTGDDAIEQAYVKTPNKIGNAIGINLRVSNYSQVNDTIIKTISKVLHKASEKLQSPLLPIPISLNKEDSDIRSIKLLLNNIHSNYEQIDTPDKIILLAGKCRVVITGSYHAGVFALSQGVPIIGLAKSQYYRDKFNGLAGQFTVGCQVIDLEQNNFSDSLEKSILNAWQLAPKLRAKLLEMAKFQIQASHQGYAKLSNILKG